jgi:hypothetical protein
MEFLNDAAALPQVVDIEQYRTGTPRGALTWDTPAQRNRVLRLWRRAVLIIFGEQPRCVRLAWVLADSFNAKKGYAFPTNGWLAEETSLKANKVQSALKDLEDGRAIVRGWVTHPSGQKQRVIYPARDIIPRHWGTPTVGVGGDPHQPGVHNLRRRTRLPKTELEQARRAAAIRENGQNRASGQQQAEAEDEPT